MLLRISNNLKCLRWTHVCQRERKKSYKNSASCHIGEASGLSGGGRSWKTMVWACCTFTMKKEAQGFWRQHIPCFGLLLQNIDWIWHKADSFEWGQSKEGVGSRSRLHGKLPCCLSLTHFKSSEPQVVGGREGCCRSPSKVPLAIGVRLHFC